MDFDRTPQNFLLWLRSRKPQLARLLDGARSIGSSGRRVEIRAPGEGWPGAEIFSRREELSSAVREFWGAGAVLELSNTPWDKERLPFPVTASKVWNHVAFFALEGEGSAVAIIRKPALEKLPAKNGGKAEIGEFEKAGGVLWRGLPSKTGEFFPSLLDRLLPLMREERSYVHLVTGFAGHEIAGELESALYAVKEWGTPLSPAPLLQKYIGRIHFADSENPSPGLALALSLAKACDINEDGR
ncbi:hypothetical protein EPN96_01425 [bacterium]|nr:MAG: hypothetical protein EPN96_01425 [bacterium]